MGGRLRSRYIRCASDQIRPRAHRKPSQRRQGAPRQEKALRLGCLTAANKLAAAFTRWLRYSLTGHVREHCLFLLHGRGKNGKSTFLNTLKKLFGDYATSLPMHT